MINVRKCIFNSCNYLYRINSYEYLLVKLFHLNDNEDDLDNLQ